MTYLIGTIATALFVAMAVAKYYLDTCPEALTDE